MPGIITTPEVMPELQRVPSWKGAAARQKARRETRGLKQQQKSPPLPAPPTIPPLAKAARPGRHTNKPPPPKAPSKPARQAGGYIAAVRQHAREESVTQHDTIKRQQQQQQVQQQEHSAQATHDTAAIVAPTKKRPLIRVGAAAQQEEQRQRERERKLRRAAVMKPIDCSSRPSSVELKPMRREEVMHDAFAFDISLPLHLVQQDRHLLHGMLRACPSLSHHCRKQQQPLVHTPRSPSLEEKKEGATEEGKKQPPQPPQQPKLLPQVVEGGAVAERVVPQAAPQPAWSQEDLKACLDRHNELRRKHGAPPLKWKDELAQDAQAAANQCVAKGMLHHSNTNGAGQNGAMGYPSFEAAIDGWYSEIKDYDFQNHGFAMNTGHFTQVVWKSCTHVGMARDTTGRGSYVFANYYPPGNFMGRFPSNVAPLTK